MTAAQLSGESGAGKAWGGPMCLGIEPEVSHIPSSWHGSRPKEQLPSLMGLEETKICQVKCFVLAGKELRLRMFQRIRLMSWSQQSQSDDCLENQDKLNNLSWLSIFFVQGTVRRPARHPNKYKLWTLSKELTITLKKLTKKNRCKETKTIMEAITQEVLNHAK